MSRRKVSNPLALAVLACLSEGPMHPYEIASTLRQRHKDASIKLNYGSLYSVIDALARNAMVAPKETVRQGKRPERTIYELTPAGQHELHDWLSELLARPEKEYTAFEAGLSLMPVLPPQTAVALLNARIDSLVTEIESMRTIESFATRRSLPRLFIIEREYQIMLREAELAWVRALAADIAEGRLDGLDKWKTWHLTNS